MKHLVQGTSRCDRGEEFRNIIRDSSNQVNPKINYSGDLNTGLVWYSNGRFVIGCQMVWYSNSGLETGLKKPVYGPKCPVFEWSAKSHDLTI